MHTNIFWVLGICLFFQPVQFVAAAPDSFTPAEKKEIQLFIDQQVGKTNSAMAVGLVDKQTSSVFAAGTLDNGTANLVDGDSMFFIGSVSKTFTALLLLEMAERREVSLDDPVAKYLPASVKAPSFSGREIRLVDLATHTAGLPFNSDNMKGSNVRDQYESYSVGQMYTFLSHYQLSREPGTRYAYSNVGFALLGHALARRADTTFESLIVERICRPLGMDNTCITLSANQQAQLAMGHDENGKPSTPWKFSAYCPAGDIHSTANDLLKYAAAQAGLRTSKLTPAIAKSQVFRFQDTTGLGDGGEYSRMGRTAMDWVDRTAVQPAGMELMGHAGGAGSYHAWVGFDTKQKRGVVVLSTANNLSVEAIGWTILQRLPLTPESSKMFARELVGIGTALDFDQESGALRITKVFAGSPASRAGVPSGCRIQKIDDVDTKGKTLAQCLELLRGPAGSKVRLEIFDPEGKGSKTVEVTRDKFIAANS
jgi:CubicO group peptidase (beta-lactamase class C family)